MGAAARGGADIEALGVLNWDNMELIKSCTADQGRNKVRYSLLIHE